MFDIKWIRDNAEAFDAGLKKRGLAPEAAKLIALDEARREHVTRLQEAQARRNAASKEIGKAKGSKDEAEAKRLMDEVAVLKASIQEGDEQERKLDKQLLDLLAGIPNLPADDIPVGPDEKASKELRKIGTPPTFSFPPKQHFEIGEALGLMDFETAAKLSGARFVVLKGALARLERALAQFMLDLHTTENGYTEINPPLLVRDDTMFGTAQLPKFKEDQFRTTKYASVEDLQPMIAQAGDRYMREWIATGRKLNPLTPELVEGHRAAVFKAIELGLGLSFDLASRPPDEIIKAEIPLWLIPTAEVPLTNLVRGDIADEAKLPLRVTAWTPCFRAEAGAAGKDTRGMIRQHQFSKVELVSITTPEQSQDEHERMTACAEEVLKRLELPFRTIVLSTGDMGFAAKKTYDIEVWLPGQGAYREISSCSNCGDFQARRMNARYRPKDAKATQFVHTLNGSGIAVGRALIAVLENYQNEDGSVRVPEVLKPYMGGIERIERAS